MAEQTSFQLFQALTLELAKAGSTDALKMNFKIFPNFCVLFTILTSIKVSLAIIGVFSKELGARLCFQQLNKNINCGIQINNQVFAEMMIYNGFPNITTPHVRIVASEGFFKVRFRDGLILPQVQFLFKVAETMEVDIDLMNTSADLVISCLSYGSLSKMSSDIIKSSENLVLTHKKVMTICLKKFLKKCTPL